MPRRLPILLATTAVCALFVAACGGSSDGTSTQSTSKGYPPIPAGPIKLGLSLSLSGPSAAHGALGEKGFAIALAQFNQMHPKGIDGHKIQFVTQNDQGSTTVAVNVAKQFVTDKVVAVVDPSEDTAAQALQMQIWRQAKLPVIGYNFTTANYADGAQWPYVFNVAAQSPSALGQASAQWISSHPTYKRIAVLIDGTPPQQQWLQDIINPLKSLAPSDSVVQTTSIDVGAVDATTQVAQLKAAKPDLVVVAVGFDLGPIWNAFHQAGWTPPILTLQNAYYDGYSSLGNLTSRAVAPAFDCISSASAPIPADVKTLMGAYVKGIGDISVNMLIFVDADTMSLEAVNYAITKFHSDSPEAIKAAMESMHNVGFIGNFFRLTFSPANHFGLTGGLGAHVCNLSPLVDGAYSIPTYAP